MPLVRVLDVDPDLAAALPEADATQAGAVVTAPVVALERGPWVPAELWDGQERPVTLLLIEGLVAREVTLAARSCRTLIGPGQVLGTADDLHSLLPSRTDWAVVQRARIVLLGDSWLRAVQHWPALSAALQRRAEEVAERAAVHTAISQLPRVEDRVVAFMLHVGDMIGRVTADGIHLPVELTHDEIGRLVGAKRPTVSLAVAALTRTGAVMRRADGTWTVRSGGLAQVPRGKPRAEPVHARRSAREGEEVVPVLLDALRERTAAMRALGADLEVRVARVMERSRENREAGRATRVRAQEVREEVAKTRRPAAPSTRSPR